MIEMTATHAEGISAWNNFVINSMHLLLSHVIHSKFLNEWMSTAFGYRQTINWKSNTPNWSCITLCKSTLFVFVFMRIFYNALNQTLWVPTYYFHVQMMHPKKWWNRIKKQHQHALAVIQWRKQTSNHFNPSAYMWHFGIAYGHLFCM